MNAVLITPSISTVRIAKLLSGTKGEFHIESIASIPTREFLKMEKAENPIYSADVSPDFVVYALPRDGVGLTQATLVDERLLYMLREQCWENPYHARAFLEVVSEMRFQLPEVPQVLVSGSSFFAELPERERMPAVSSAMAKDLVAARSGIHGVFHRAAQDAAQTALETNGPDATTRVLSLCLDTSSEATAILNGRPVLVTRGNTPLEGLPGDTTCGEIDPGIVLYLADSLGLGPEEIGQILTRESGLSALVGEDTTLAAVAEARTEREAAAWRLFIYRMTLVLGEALAALGGLDAIVFSGTYREVGQKLTPVLEQRLRQIPTQPTPVYLSVDASFEELAVREGLQLLARVA